MPVLQRIEAGGRRQRHVLDLVEIAEHRRGDGAADIDVEAGPVALGAPVGEAGQPVADAADQAVAGTDIVEGAGLGRRMDERRNRQRLGPRPRRLRMI